MAALVGGPWGVAMAPGGQLDAGRGAEDWKYCELLQCIIVQFSLVEWSAGRVLSIWYSLSSVPHETINTSYLFFVSVEVTCYY